jgi:hypothetical protein
MDLKCRREEEKKCMISRQKCMEYKVQYQWMDAKRENRKEMGLMDGYETRRWMMLCVKNIVAIRCRVDVYVYGVDGCVQTISEWMED